MPRRAGEAAAAGALGPPVGREGCSQAQRQPAPVTSPPQAAAAARARGPPDELESPCSLQGQGRADDGSASCHIPLGSLPSSFFAKCCLRRGPECVPVPWVTPVSPSHQGRADGTSRWTRRGRPGGRSPGVCWCPRGASPSCCPPCSCSDPGSVTSGGRGAGTQDELTVAMTTRSYHHQPGALAVVFPPQSCPGTQDVVAVGDTGAAPARVTGRGWLLPVLCGTNGSRNSAPSARSLCWEVGSCSRQGTLKLSGVSPAP